MLKKRIIPCLDIQDGRTVKGINFVSIRDAGDPIALAEKYVQQGADELVFLDITATIEKRKTLIALVRQISKKINIPFTVGGGINTKEDVRELLAAGADKVSINSSAVKRPGFISEISNEYGGQCIVVAIDTKFICNNWRVFIHGGRKLTAMKTIDWARQVEQLGAGEILLTSMNNDGTKAGFAIELINKVTEQVNIPVIASGGAGDKFHFKEIFKNTKATGGLAASIFHFGEVSIPELKKYLIANNISVRIN